MIGQVARVQPFGWIVALELEDGRRELRWGHASTKGDAVQAVGDLTPCNGIGALYSGRVEADRVQLDDVAGTLPRAGSLLGTLTIGNGLRAPRDRT